MESSVRTDRTARQAKRTSSGCCWPKLEPGFARTPASRGGAHCLRAVAGFAEAGEDVATRFIVLEPEIAAEDRSREQDAVRSTEGLPKLCVRRTVMAFAARFPHTPEETAVVHVVKIYLPACTAPHEITQPQDPRVIEVEPAHDVRTSDFAERIVVHRTSRWRLDEPCVVGSVLRNEVPHFAPVTGMSTIEVALVEVSLRRWQRMRSGRTLRLPWSRITRKQAGATAACDALTQRCFKCGRAIYDSTVEHPPPHPCEICGVIGWIASKHGLNPRDILSRPGAAELSALKRYGVGDHGVELRRPTLNVLYARILTIAEALFGIQ